MTEDEYRQAFTMLKLQENLEKEEYKRKEISNKLRNLESTYKQASVRNSAKDLDDMFSMIQSDETMELHDTEIKGVKSR